MGGIQKPQQSLYTRYYCTLWCIWWEDSVKIDLTRREDDDNEVYMYKEQKRSCIKLHTVGTRATQCIAAICEWQGKFHTFIAPLLWSPSSGMTGTTMCTHTMTECMISLKSISQINQWNQLCTKQCLPCNSYPWQLGGYLHCHSGWV